MMGGVKSAGFAGETQATPLTVRLLTWDGYAPREVQDVFIKWMKARSPVTEKGVERFLHAVEDTP
ncbi:hypothetical protein [Desulfoluna sp.]|uniref:hypothetical protein n=1 Tax=Desulfoluna sp. TaxID=2045199 RepID=UPI0026175D5C|nr:hypothetical protein [Desulfoluna sp.]